MPKVELLYDSDCPNVALARANLRCAFVRANVEARWSERRIDENDASRVGSPTILVDGSDVVPQGRGDGACCRIYAGADGLRGAPSVDSIVAALRAAQRRVTSV